jgi:hypothetical protein
MRCVSLRRAPGNLRCFQVAAPLAGAGRGGGRCGVRRRSTQFCALGSRTGNRGQSVAKGYDASSAAGTLIIEKNCSIILRMRYGGNVSRLSR